MGFFRQLFGRRAHPSQHSLAAIFGDAENTHAGVAVTEQTALTLSTVFACVRVLAESVASLPLLTYRRLANGGKERAENHPLYPLLREQANPEMTSFELRETLIAHVATWGNGYAEIEWDRAGRTLALWPLNPARMTVERKGGVLVYQYALSDGGVVQLPAYRVHHVRGLGGNGVQGFSVVRMAMNSIGLALGTEEFGARFFGNGARPGGVLKHPGRLSDTAYERLRKSWTDAHEGLSNAHRLKILEEGLDYQAIGVPLNEAQFLETRKFQVVEVARWFRIPPHMIGDLERATFSNIEHQSIDFVVHTLRPWLVRSEQALMRDLLTPEEQRTYFVEYLVDGLLRGDIASRYQAYSIGRQNGWLSANDIRQFENMNPIVGGEVYLLPLNMVSADQVQGGSNQKAAGRSQRTETRADDADEEDDSAEGESDDTKTWRRSKQKLARDYVPLFGDVAGRMVRREVNDVRRAINKHLRKRSVSDFREWLLTFYAEFVGILVEGFTPLLQTYAAQVATATADELGKDDPGVTDELKEFIERYLAAVAEGYTASSRNQIEALITDAEAEGQDVAAAIEERLDGWEESRGDQMGLGQAFEAGNALAVALYGYFSVRRLRWAASGKSCAFCLRLSGKTAGIEEYFVRKGETVSGGANDAPMLVRRNTRHGPLHKGCDCVVVAA